MFQLLTSNPQPLTLGKVYTEGTPAFLPSSLTNIVPYALGFSPHPPVSVYGTVTIQFGSWR